MELQLLGEDGPLTRVGCKGEVSQIRFRAGGNPLEELLGVDCYRRQVLLDLHAAEWIDSSGISWLIVSHKRFTDGQGVLVLHSLPPRVRTVLQYCRIDSVLNVAPDEPAALLLATRSRT